MKRGVWRTQGAVLTAAIAVLGFGVFAGIALASGGGDAATPQDTTTPVPVPPTTTIAPTPDPAPKPAPIPRPAPKPAPAPRPAPTPPVVRSSPAPVVHTAPHVTAVSRPASRPTPLPTPPVHPRRVRVRKKPVRHKVHVRHVRTVHARRHYVLAVKATHVHLRVAQKLAEKSPKAAAPVAISATTASTRRRLVIIALLAIASLVLAVGAVPPRRLPLRLASAIDERRIEILVAGAGALAGAILTVLLTGGS